MWRMADPSLRWPDDVLVGSCWICANAELYRSPGILLSTRYCSWARASSAVSNVKAMHGSNAGVDMRRKKTSLHGAKIRQGVTEVNPQTSPGQRLWSNVQERHPANDLPVSSSLRCRRVGRRQIGSAERESFVHGLCSIHHMLRSDPHLVRLVLTFRLFILIRTPHDRRHRLHDFHP